MKNLYSLNDEEKQRILNLHENATKRQYLGEQLTDETGKYTPVYKPEVGPDTQVDASKKFTPAAMACIKQFGEYKPAKTPGFVQVETDKATVFFSKDYEVRYRPTGGEIIKGQWSCMSNVFNINLNDDSTWSRAQGGWKNPTINTKPQVKINPVLQQTMTINKQIQQKLGLKQTGKLTHNELEVLIKTLTPNATPTQQ
jgi:hypothetical protein